MPAEQIKALACRDMRPAFLLDTDSATHHYQQPRVRLLKRAALG
jgi:hypothetical protein